MSSNNPYEILGVATDATTEEIKAAYKRAAQEHHPDKNNGDGDRFVEVKLAYEVLSDADRRRQYDETGEYERNQKVDHTKQVFVNLFLVVMSSGLDVIHENIFHAMRKTARDKIAEIDKADKDLLAEGDRLDEVLERAFNPNGENLIAGVVQDKLDTINRAMDGNEVERQTVLNVLDMLDDYEYRPDVVQQITADDITKYGGATFTGGSGIDWGAAT